MSKDTASQLTPVVALNTATIGSDTTTAGNSIDLQDDLACTFLIHSGARSAGTATPLVEDSPNNSDWTAVADDFLVGTEAGAALAAANSVKKLGYIGKNRYVRLSLVTTGSTSGFALGATAVLRPRSV